MVQKYCRNVKKLQQKKEYAVAGKLRFYYKKTRGCLKKNICTIQKEVLSLWCNTQFFYVSFQKILC